MKKSAFFYHKKPYLPQSSRFFTAVTGFLLATGIVVGGVWLFYHPTLPIQVHAKRSAMENELSIDQLEKNYNWWNEIVAKQPEYLDGYLMASYYAKLLRKHDEALSLLNRALAVDPNNETIRAFKEQEKMGMER